MAAVDNFIELGLAGGNLSESTNEPDLLPVAVARELYDTLLGRDFNAATTADQKKALLREVQQAIQSSKPLWTQWIQAPHIRNGKQVRAKHTQTSLFEVLRKVSGSLRRELADPQTEQAQQPTVKEDSQAEPGSEYIEHSITVPPPNEPTPAVVDVSETFQQEAAKHTDKLKVEPLCRPPPVKPKSSRKKSQIELVQQRRLEDMEQQVLEQRPVSVRPVDLSKILRVMRGSK